jgi:hypothetical protein
MHPIRGKIFTHSYDSESPDNIVEMNITDLKEEKSVFEVNSYEKLVKCVAQLGYLNPQFNLLFRGQDKDHMDLYGSSIYPRIFRHKSEKETEKLFIELNKNCENLESKKNLISLKKAKNSLLKSILRYPEFYYALLEHYQKNETPLINLTQSLHVAASFALINGQKSGYVLVFGMPHPHGSISYFIDQDMVLVKLQNVCPPEALRPHYQEGYLASNYPFNQQRLKGDNLARRLIGKYYLDDSKGKFWDKDFLRFSKEVLYPDRKDTFLKKLNDILERE